jgi:hypothetical protein
MLTLELSVHDYHFLARGSLAKFSDETELKRQALNFAIIQSMRVWRKRV